jgi:FAD/FMN-containing dehydrogenase
LAEHLQGTIHLPGEPDYDRARRAWNLNADHRPAAVVMAASTADVRNSVCFATRSGLGVGVMATGHGTGTPSGSDGLLINTSGLRRVVVDPDQRTADVAAGTRWREVITTAAPHGLAALAGSSPDTGVVGYTLGGGFGWLGRRFGLAARSMIEADMVTADGERRTISAETDPDLWWGLRGSGGNLGVVTRLRFRLYPVSTVYAGNLYYPPERAADLLSFFAEWTRDTPGELTAALTFRSFPPAPSIPCPLRGRSLVALRGCWSGSLGEGAALIDRARAALGAPLVDSFTAMPSAELATVSMDPADPLPVAGHSALLADLTPRAIAAVLQHAGPAARSPLVMLELRQLGGALEVPVGQLSPMAHTAARFSLNAIGITATTEQHLAVRAHLDRLACAVRPFATGETYLNFLDTDGATPAGVAAAYTPADLRRLHRIKQRADPFNTFRFNRNLPPLSHQLSEEAS